MPYLARQHVYNNFQAWLCIYVLYYVSTLGPLLSGNTPLLRLFIYPFFGILLLIFCLQFIYLRSSFRVLPGLSIYLYIIIISLSILCIFRGFFQPIDINSIRSLLFSRSESILVWIIPLGLHFGVSSRFWFHLFLRIRLLISIGILYTFLFLSLGLSSGNIFEHKMYNSCDYLFLAPLLIALSVIKFNKINIIIGAIGIIMLNLLMFSAGERFAIAFEGLIIVFYILLVIVMKKRLKVKMYLMLITIIVASFSSLFIFKSEFFSRQIERYFVEGAAWQESRGDGLLMRSVPKDMNLLQKMFGKGIKGTYEVEHTYLDRGYKVRYDRSSVEIGYMQMFLKAGSLYVFVFVSISIIAVFLGPFS